MRFPEDLIGKPNLIHGETPVSRICEIDPYKAPIIDE